MESLLVERKIAGPNLAHSRANNLANIHRLTDGDHGVTLGIDLIHEQIRQSPLSAQQVLDLIAGITRCSQHLAYEEGLGYINPSATYEGLCEAADRLRGGIEQRCSFLFASGHPKNMAPAYEELATYVRSRGCEVIAGSPEGTPEYDGLCLDLRGSVYVVTRDGEPAHTHGHRHAQALLERVGPVGMAVADHGFGGAALNLGIPTICVMDTNDPGVAVAAALGSPVTVVPLNDNLPGDVLHVLADIIIEMIDGGEPPQR